MVSLIISSEANEIISTRFLLLLHVNSDWRESISDWTVKSVFKISVVRGQPLGLDITHTHPDLGHHRLLYKKSHAFNIDEKEIVIPQ